MEGWKTYLTNFLLLIPLLLDRFTAIIPVQYLDEYAAIVVLVNFVLRRLTVGPDGIAKMLACLLLVCFVPMSAVAQDDLPLPVPAPDLGNPTVANVVDPPEPPEPGPPPTSIVRVVRSTPTDRCKCDPCECDPCVCGYAPTGRFENRKVCDGDTCRIERVWIAGGIRNSQAAATKQRTTSGKRRGWFLFRGRR